MTTIDSHAIHGRHGRIEALKAAARRRILVLDGSWGVMIQRRGLSEAIGVVSVIPHRCVM